MVEMQHKKLHNLVVTTLGAEMRKKIKKRNTDQEWFESEIRALAKLVNKREILTLQLAGLERRLVRILEEDSDLYDNPRDVADLTQYIDDLKKAIATGIAGLNSEILTKENNIVLLNNKKIRDMEAKEQEIRNIHKDLNEADEAPF